MNRITHTQKVGHSLNEVCESVVDCPNRTAPSIDEVTPYKMIRTTNIKNGWIDLSKVKYVNEETYRKWTRRQVPKRGDVILTREAPLGEVGMLRSNDHVFLGQRLVSYRADVEKLDAAFLLYSLCTDDLQGQIRAFGSGSTVEHMRVPDAKGLMLSLPPLPTQQRIASILSAYDDLIENNTRRIAVLEEMARRLYEEWFVHLRFPGHEEAKFDGELPRGWSTVVLADTASVNPESIKPKTAPEHIRYIDIASVSPGRIGAVQELPFAEAPGRARRIVRDGDVIWSCVRPNRRSFALVLNPADDTVASTGFAVLRAGEVPFSYLYCATTTDAFVDYLTNNATGAAYPAVKQSDFESAELVMPFPSMLAAFDQATQPMLRLSDALQRKNANLRAQRDLLLPKLVSGEIDLSFAEASLEAAE